MTKQSVVVPEVTVAMPPNTAALFPYPPPRAMPGVAVRKKYLQAQVDLGSGLINGWVESMRASSPTHAKAAAALAAGVDDEHTAWMMRLALRSVAKQFPTAIVSGRCRDKVFDFVKLAELYYAGSHGMDIKGPAKASRHTKAAKAKGVLFQPASEFIPMIEQVNESLVEKTKCIPGSKVENNKFCVSVHFRCVDEKSWSTLADIVKAVLKDYPKLKLTQGRKVLEIRPTIKWDKGKALEFLLESLGFADCSNVLPVYIGDDRTDEDAFKVLRKRDQGIGILVSKHSKETNASYSLQEPAEGLSTKVMRMRNCYGGCGGLILIQYDLGGGYFLNRSRKYLLASTIDVIVTYLDRLACSLRRRSKAELLARTWLVDGPVIVGDLCPQRNK